MLSASAHISHPLVAHFNWQFGGDCQQEMKWAQDLAKERQGEA